MDTPVQPLSTGPVSDAADRPDSRAPERAAFAQFAVDAVDRRIGRVTGALTGIADSFDDLIARADPPIAEPFAGYAASASDGLRKLARRAGDQDAAGLIGGIGRAATSHPVATAGIGAAMGAAIGLAVVALGRSADRAQPGIATG